MAQWTLRDGLPVPLQIFQRPAHGRYTHRPVIAQHFFDGAFHQVRLGLQLAHLIGILQQRQCTVADQINSCLVTGHQQQKNHADEFLLVKFVAGFFHLYQTADEIVGRFGTAEDRVTPVTA